MGVNLWYKVGSKNEKAGRTGFAHLFEHLMFQGSQHHDNEYFGPIEKVGAQINGSTNTDRTNYYETVPEQRASSWPSGSSPTGWGSSLPALTQAEARQPARRGQERAAAAGRQRALRPGARRRCSRPCIPPDHPYHHSVIGSMADLSAASLDDVSTFFRTYYSPNNASLCIAGDFEPAETKRLVEKYFGPLPAGPRSRGSRRASPTLAEPEARSR